MFSKSEKLKSFYEYCIYFYENFIFKQKLKKQDIILIINIK